jgi:hypothetical protein
MKAEITKDIGYVACQTANGEGTEYLPEDQEPDRGFTITLHSGEIFDVTGVIVNIDFGVDLPVPITAIKALT